MPSRPARRADDKRLAEPGKKRTKSSPGGIQGPRTRMELWEAGELKVSDMTDKELKKGRFADINGTFKGRPTKTVPRKFFQELDQERLKRWNEKVLKELDASLEALKEIRDNRRAPADARYKSAVYLVERAAGKVPDKSEVKVEVAKWEENIEGIVFDDDEEKAG